MGMHEVSFIRSRLTKFIDTLEFVPGNIYYLVDTLNNMSAIVICSERNSEVAKFIRCYVISGKWPSEIDNVFIIHADETSDFYDNIRLYEVVPKIQIDQMNMIMHIRADFELKM